MLCRYATGDPDLEKDFEKCLQEAEAANREVEEKKSAQVCDGICIHVWEYECSVFLGGYTYVYELPIHMWSGMCALVLAVMCMPVCNWSMCVCI